MHCAGLCGAVLGSSLRCLSLGGWLLLPRLMGVQECGAWVGSFWGCWLSCAFGHGAWVVLASTVLGLSGLFAVPRLLWRSGPFSHLLRLLAGLNYIFMLALDTGVHFDACFSHSTLVFSASWFLRHEAQNPQILGFMTFVFW